MEDSTRFFFIGLSLATLLTHQGCVTASSLQQEVLGNVNEGSVAVQAMSCDPGNGQFVALGLEEDNRPEFDIGISIDEFASHGSEQWFEVGRDALLKYARNEVPRNLDTPSSQHDVFALGTISNERLSELLSAPVGVVSIAEEVISDLSNAIPDYESPSNSEVFELPESLMGPDKFAEIISKRGWDAALVASYGRVLWLDSLARADNQVLKSRAAMEVRADHRRKKFVSEYFSAYFKHGQIFRVELVTHTTREELLAKLTEGIEDPDVINEIKKKIDETFDSLLDGVCKGGKDDACVVLGVENEASFVSRAGKTISFPGVVATVDPGADKKVSTNKLDTEDIGHELLEVLIEAVADAKYTVPGAPNSTLCQEIDARFCQKDEDKEKISAVNESAARTEASARSIVSILVRGGWLFSLNNESLADWIETLSAVTARKVSEAAEWSKQSCGPRLADRAPDGFIDLKVKIPSAPLSKYTK